MNSSSLSEKILTLKDILQGDVFTDETSLLLYATDASAYREKPLAVVRPKNVDDLKNLISFARENGTSLIPRTAGTSLAGQVVGNGIVADVSRYLTEILEINQEEHWVRVQPGVVLDELNKKLEPFGLFFGPETSTSNRCMIGGMVGNNSCGSHSLVYGSTRDHTLSIKAILSDGSDAEFRQLTLDEFNEKCLLQNLEGAIYCNIRDILSLKENRQEIREQYPDKKVKRRNTGYAIDLLLESEPFVFGAEKFNFCKLIAGSEGTLCFLTEIKLNLVPLPPKEKAVVAVHCHSLEDAFLGNLIALKSHPVAVELIDSVIIEQTKHNIEQRKNRFFIEGEPAALLIVEFASATKEEVAEKTKEVEDNLRKAGYGYHFPVITGSDISKVWALRKAGLGLLSNVPGDRKPVPVTEDTAVSPEFLPDYMKDFKAMLDGFGLSCVYYAHIATGELHLRPALNLKDPADVELFHTVALETAKIVKKYKGSLSGEHGDGRLRGEFIPLMIGEHNYALLKKIKATWDSQYIFNPGKIIDTPAMNTFLRFEAGKKTREIDTIFDFSSTNGFLRAIEQCNGSADCRKSSIMGGTMCPSFMATKDENTTTRARANLLREILSRSEKKNPFDNKELYKILDLCLSCKGCKAECPSNVDMAKFKAEFLQHYYDANRISLRTRLIAYITQVNKLGMVLPSVFNAVVKSSFLSGLLKKMLGFASKRSIPALYKMTLRCWAKKNNNKINIENKFGKVYLFADEFSNYNDVEIGIKAIKLLNKLGYEVVIPYHTESGRTFLSKGLVRKAKKLAETNVLKLKDIINEKTPLIGIEPSAILSFRDEYPDLVRKDMKEDAHKLATNCLLYDEFFIREAEKGNITSDVFTKNVLNIKLHGHCHQKSLASVLLTKKMLSLPENYHVEEIKSGCCGMAGSFGYEKEHYEFSMKVGELTLFPSIRQSGKETIISAPGTSCRQQIKDGTGRTAFHPIEILYDALA
ncbi:MAG: FAD-binding protein [Lentimicrobiaceae bacterium]|nr:FAD-binding protein [Lentimicrobiaceae bacterium]